MFYGFVRWTEHIGCPETLARLSQRTVRLITPVGLISAHVHEPSGFPPKRPCVSLSKILLPAQTPQVS